MKKKVFIVTKYVFFIALHCHSSVFLYTTACSHIMHISTTQNTRLRLYRAEIC